jgi:hypothetical protein
MLEPDLWPNGRRVILGYFDGSNGSDGLADGLLTR